jgi:hypothetical protein
MQRVRLKCCFIGVISLRLRMIGPPLNYVAAALPTEDYRSSFWGLEVSLIDVEAGGYQLFDELIYRTRLWPRTAKAVDDRKR